MVFFRNCSRFIIVLNVAADLVGVLFPQFILVNTSFISAAVRFERECRICIIPVNHFISRSHPPFSNK